MKNGLRWQGKELFRNKNKKFNLDFSSTIFIKKFTSNNSSVVLERMR